MIVFCLTVLSLLLSLPNHIFCEGPFYIQSHIMMLFVRKCTFYRIFSLDCLLVTICGLVGFRFMQLSLHKLASLYLLVL